MGENIQYSPCLIAIIKSDHFYQIPTFLFFKEVLNQRYIFFVQPQQISFNS